MIDSIISNLKNNMDKNHLILKIFLYPEMIYCSTKLILPTKEREGDFSLPI